MKRTKEEAKITKEKLLKTAVKLFIENGYDNTSLAAIAKETGVTKGAIFWHFKNKSSILDDIIDYYDKEAIDYIPKIKDAPVSPLMKIKFFTYAYIPDFSDRKKISNLCKIKSEIANHYRSRKKQPYAKSFIEAIEELFDEAKTAGEVKSDVNSHISALTINLIITGIYIKYDTDAGFFKKLKSLVELMDNYFEMISTKKGIEKTKNHRALLKKVLPQLSEYY